MMGPFITVVWHVSGGMNEASSLQVVLVLAAVINVREALLTKEHPWSNITSSVRPGTNCTWPDFKGILQNVACASTD